MAKEIKNNECKSICARCGGECCLRMPGAYFPEQLGLKEGQDENNAKILAALFPNCMETKYRILEGIGKPSSYNFFGEYDPLSEEELADHDWCCNKVILPAPGDKSCCHWTDTGCLLSWEDRPTMCKALSPSEPDSKGWRYCQSEISLRELSRVWSPFQNILKVCSDLLWLQKQHREIWDDCYGHKGNITEEVILFFLKKKKDVWSFCFKESEKKKQKEEQRIKHESNPLFVALKNAGF